jgi:hypothetical protein
MSAIRKRTMRYAALQGCALSGELGPSASASFVHSRHSFLNPRHIGCVPASEKSATVANFVRPDYSTVKFSVVVKDPLAVLIVTGPVLAPGGTAT